MRLSKSWVVTRKDLSIFRTKRSLLYSLVAFPLGIGLGLPTVVWLSVRKTHASYAALIPLLDTFLFFFIIAAVSLASTLAAYAIVGEKVERSLEPLLATPTTDSEILFGKSLAAFLPSLAATYFGAAVFMAYVDVLTLPTLGYLLYPNGTAGIFLLFATPLACLFGVEVNILVSSKVSDIRAATQLAGVLVLPFAGIYVLGEIGVLTIDTSTLLLISGGLIALDVALFFLSTATFRREEILTKWT